MNGLSSTRGTVVAAGLLALSLGTGVLANLGVSDRGVVKNTVLQVTVTGVAGNVTITHRELGVELEGCQAGAGTVRVVEYAGTGSTTPRKGWKIQVSDGTRSVNHTVKTSLGSGPSGPVISNYQFDPVNSQLSFQPPQGPPLSGQMSGQLVKHDIDVDADPDSPTFGEEVYVLPALLFNAVLQTNMGPINISLPQDVPGSINLSNIWESLQGCQGICPIETMTSVNQHFPFQVNNFPGLNPFIVDGTFTGNINFAAEISGQDQQLGYREDIVGLYQGVANTEIGTIQVQGPIRLTGATHSPDEDGDSVPDNVDNCLGLPNFSQADADADAVGDACDLCPNSPASQSVGLNGCPFGLCLWDLNGDSVVGIVDFLQLLGMWGTCPGGPPDFDADGNVGILDFLALLAAWGPCP